MTKLDLYEKRAGIYMLLVILASLILQIEHGNFDTFWETVSFILIFVCGVLMGFNAGLSGGRKRK